MTQNMGGQEKGKDPQSGPGWKAKSNTGTDGGMTGNSERSHIFLISRSLFIIIFYHGLRWSSITQRTIKERKEKKTSLDPQKIAHLALCSQSPVGPSACLEWDQNKAATRWFQRMELTSGSLR